jgi:glycosyltransferase involved in cell wall biosynthesis
MNGHTPTVSVIVIAYNMPREIPRTVYSFLPPFQREIDPDDVEIIVVENGSDRPVAREDIEAWPKNVVYCQPDRILPSPAYALNYGASRARGRLLCPVIDGARMASPGLLANGIAANRLGETSFAATVGLHLGHEPQQFSVSKGYDQKAEDELLESIDWRENGYRMFDIACFGRSAESGWFGRISESNAPVLSARFYDRIGGYDTRFDIPGGGLVNLDFFRRCVEDPETRYSMLLGEGTFHQYHGGVTTSRPIREMPGDGERSVWDVYVDQYRQIRGKAWKPPGAKPYLFGSTVGHGRASVMRAMQRGLNKALSDLQR